MVKRVRPYAINVVLDVDSWERLQETIALCHKAGMPDHGLKTVIVKEGLVFACEMYQAKAKRILNG